VTDRKATVKTNQKKREATDQSISSVLPKPLEIEAAGVTCLFGRPRFRDLRDIEAEFGPYDRFLAELEEGKVSAALYLLFIQFRRSFPDLRIDDMEEWLEENEVDVAEASRLAFLALQGRQEPDPNPAGGEVVTEPPTGES
jgi:hypothetical protein